jgi:NAD(P)-dependent dehydrogenase (short-subunit alcohol dehydrogenase family)
MRRISGSIRWGFRDRWGAVILAAANDVGSAFHRVGRMGEVHDIIDAVLYPEGASFVTGEILNVDGGQSAGH